MASLKLYVRSRLLRKMQCVGVAACKDICLHAGPTHLRQPMGFLFTLFCYFLPLLVVPWLKSQGRGYIRLSAAADDRKLGALSSLASNNSTNEHDIGAARFAHERTSQDFIYYEYNTGRGAKAGRDNSITQSITMGAAYTQAYSLQRG